MKKLINRFLDYVVKDRRTPNKNRERVGQNLMILAVFLFFVFVINFAIIIGTDTKFGHNLSTEASEVYQKEVTVQAKRVRFMTVMVLLLQRIQQPTVSMLLFQHLMFHQQAKNYMSKNLSMRKWQRF